MLDCVRHKHAMTATDLVEETGCSAATVNRIVKDLIEQGLLRHDGFEESGGGRPRARIRFEGRRHAVIGVEASSDGFFAEIADLNGHILARRQADAGATSEENIARLVAVIDLLLSEAVLFDKRLIGIGVGVPSIVRQPEGEVVLTLGLGWRDLPLGQLLRDRFGTRVLIENDRNLAALGEWSVESGNAIDSLVSLAIAPGAGAGIIINGRLLRGRSNASGELSWFLEDPRLTGRQFARLGDKDHLRFAGISPAIIERLQAAARDYAAGRLTLEALATAQPTGPLGEIRDLIDFATMGVASIASLLNPDLVVLTGGIARGGELVLDAMRAQLRDSLFDPPDLRMTRLGAQDIVLGAIHALLEDHVTSPARGVAVA